MAFHATPHTEASPRPFLTTPVTCPTCHRAYGAATSEPDPLLTSQQVGQMFGVHAKTITRWEQLGKLKATIKTSGGHRRYRRSEVLKAISEFQKEHKQP
jgi:hypothetical protein